MTKIKYFSRDFSARPPRKAAGWCKERENSDAERGKERNRLLPIPETKIFGGELDGVPFALGDNAHIGMISHLNITNTHSAFGIV